MPDDTVKKHILLSGTPEHILSEIYGQYKDRPVETIWRNELDRLSHFMAGSIPDTPQGINLCATLNQIAERRPESQFFQRLYLRNGAHNAKCYASDPFITRDLYKNQRTPDRNTGGEFFSLEDSTAPVHVTRQTFSKPGNLPFRFVRADFPHHDKNGKASLLRVPLVLLADEACDSIIKYQSEAILDDLYFVAALSNHDHLHNAIRKQVKDAPTAHLWNVGIRDKTPAGTSRTLLNKHHDAAFMQNYELLLSIAQRKTIAQAIQECPALEKEIERHTEHFIDGVHQLTGRMQQQGDDAHAKQLEEYFITNYFRFLCHVISPEAPALQPHLLAHPYVSHHLNITNGTGLVSALHKFDSVPDNTREENHFIPFSQWLTRYNDALVGQIDTHYQNLAAQSDTPAYLRNLAAAKERQELGLPTPQQRTR